MMERSEGQRFTGETDGTVSDGELVRQWQNGGPRERISQILYFRYQSSIKALFRRLEMTIEVDDLSQETFIAAFKGLDGFRTEASFRNWLFQIARNTALKARRHRNTLKRSAEKEVSLTELLTLTDEPLDPGLECPLSDNPLAKTLANEDRKRLNEAVARLAPEDRTMVHFRIFQGLSVRETGIAMKKPEGTVKSRWARICKTLRRELSRFDADLTLVGENRK